MSKNILLDLGEYQIKTTGNRNSKQKLYLWHPKTSTLHGRGRTIDELREQLDKLLRLNYFAASHPWGKEMHNDNASRT